jgi:Ran GTPase-activating protein (RanGAP) involved in mRNA processing and transport
MSSSSDDSSDVSLPEHHLVTGPFTGCQSSSDEESDDANVPLVELLRTEFCKSFSRAQVTTSVIKLDGLSLDHSDARVIAFNLRQFTRIRTLSLNWNHVKHGAFFIAELLRVNSGIRKISMNGNDIQCNGAKHLADTLKCSDCKVRDLEIDDNGIASAGAMSLAASLKFNTSLRNLTLRGNPIGDLGAEAIATVLVANSSLKVLRVDECGISRSGAISLLRAIGQTPRLKLFDLSGNKLSSPSVPRAPLILSASSALRELIIRFARLDDSDLVQLSVALLKTPQLETLSLDGNSLTDNSCDLLRTLLLNCPLCSLNLSANQFGCRTASVLLRSSLNCDRIVRLNFGTNNPCGTPSECGKSADWKTCGLPALPEHFAVDTWAAASRHCRIMLHMFAVDTGARAKSRGLLQMQLRLSKDLSESEAEMLKTSDWWLHVFSKHSCPQELVSAIFQSRLNIPLQKQ